MQSAFGFSTSSFLYSAGNFSKSTIGFLNARTRSIDTLLRIVSHDIANPLMVVQGMTDTLLNSYDHDKRILFALSKIQVSADNIEKILIRVKSIQAMKSGKVTIKTQNLSLSEMFAKSEDVFESRLRQKNLSLFLIFQDQVNDVYFLGEEVTFHNDILNNLISNAIKFSHETGKIVVKGSIEGEMVKIEVRDEGVGMPKSLAKDVFDDFKQTSREGTSGETGTGFGLPITKFLVVAFGGYIEVETREEKDHPQDHGTSFFVYLPKGQSLKTLTYQSLLSPNYR